MKHTSIVRMLALCLCLFLSLGALGCADSGTPGDTPPSGNTEQRSALTLYASLRDQATAANGCLSLHSSAALQMGESTARVSLYAATDGVGVYSISEIASGGKHSKSSYAYTDGALRSDGKVIPMTPDQYRENYGFPSLPHLEDVRLVNLPVYKEIGGYYFTVSASPSGASDFLRGVLGPELYALYAQCTPKTLAYTFHYFDNGEADRLSIRAELKMGEQDITLNCSVRYADFGTARPVPPSTM